MDLYVARQPIFDKHMNVSAYELLYRKSRENRFTDTDQDEATAHVMLNSFHVMGLDGLTGGKPAFVNFTENFLTEGLATLFPAESLVVEVLETVLPTAPVLSALRELKGLGYRIALDDFVDSPVHRSLVDLADIIKVDFRLSSRWECERIVRELSNGRIRFLAEKIETEEEFRLALKMGYTYFQGYWFAKPVIQPIEDVPPVRLNYLRLIERVNSTSFEFDDIAELIVQDVSLTYKLLKLVNSSAFGLRQKIGTVRQALVILGIREIRKWVSLISIRGIGEDKPDELVRLSLIRAKFAELLGKAASLPIRSDELFLTGLFSSLDALMGRPLNEVIASIPLPNAVRDALLARDGDAGIILDLVLTQERGHFDELQPLADHLGIPCDDLIDVWIEAVIWSNVLFAEQ